MGQLRKQPAVSELLRDRAVDHPRQQALRQDMEALPAPRLRVVRGPRHRIPNTGRDPSRIVEINFHPQQEWDESLWRISPRSARRGVSHAHAGGPKLAPQGH